MSHISERIVHINGGGKKTHAPPRIIVGWNNRANTVSIKASTMWFKKYNKSFPPRHTDPPPALSSKHHRSVYKDKWDRWHVLWSMHSDLSELMALTRGLNPLRIVPSSDIVGARTGDSESWSMVLEMLMGGGIGTSLMGGGIETSTLDLDSKENEGITLEKCILSQMDQKLVDMLDDASDRVISISDGDTTLVDTEPE
eukprot:GHVO01041265.1.p1 GENE.GHVO01041265.1~~GHVO01041265.1.p1  ORF type:complete len:231 (+),score=41.82 GHVO01041265.1:101-694(+)